MLSNKKVKFCITSLICFFSVVQFSFSAVPTNIDSTLIVDSSQISQDSLFVIINNSFEIVKPMLVNSCYDCHSANTREPWYFNIPGINSFVTSHIKEGREHLDFTDDFPFHSKEPILEALNDIKEEVKEGEMPLFSYRIMHWGRLIEGAQQDTLFQWIQQTETALKEFYINNNILFESENSKEAEESEESED